MPIADSQITFTEVGGTGTLTLDVFYMGVDALDVINRNISGDTYIRDVADHARIQEVHIYVHRIALTRPEFDQIYLWVAYGTLLDLTDIANDYPIASYRGRLARIQPDMFHEAKMGPGPYELVFKPDYSVRKI